MMACSKVFTRLTTNLKLCRRMMHYKNTKTHRSLLEKAKDTVLLIEATKGPAGKVACGLAQATGAAALSFGTGLGVIHLITFFNPTLETSSNRREVVGHFPKTDADDDALASRRIGLTYFHMACSLIASSVTAFLSFRLFRNKAFLVQLGGKPLVMLGVGVVTPFLIASIVHKLPKTKMEDDKLIPFGLKELGHLLYAGTVGLAAAPFYLLGGQSIFRAAFVTAGACAGLEGVVRMAPKHIFMTWGTFLNYANTAILASFIMTLLLRRNHFAFKPLYRFMMHGGLLIYSAHYMYIAQGINHFAKSPAYDPVNASMALTMDLLNLYGRLAFLLPPYFQLSNDHHFIMHRGRSLITGSPVDKNNIGKNTNSKNNFKPENET